MLIALAINFISCSETPPVGPVNGPPTDTTNNGEPPDTIGQNGQPVVVPIEQHAFVVSSETASYLLMAQFDHNNPSFETIARIEALSTPMPYGVISAMNQDTIISLHNGITKTFRAGSYGFSNFSRAERVLANPSFMSVINRNVAVIMSAENSSLQVFNPITLESSYELALNGYRPYMGVVKNSLLYIAVEGRNIMLIFDPAEQAITDSISIPFADPFLVKSFDETHIALGSSNPTDGGIARLNIETRDYEFLYRNSSNTRIPEKHFQFDSRGRLYFLHSSTQGLRIARFANNNTIDIAPAIQDEIFFFFLTHGYIVINTAFNSDQAGFEDFTHSLRYYDINTLESAATTFNLLNGSITYKIQ